MKTTTTAPRREASAFPLLLAIPLAVVHVGGCGPDDNPVPAQAAVTSGQPTSSDMPGQSTSVPSQGPTSAPTTQSPTTTSTASNSTPTNTMATSDPVVPTSSATDDMSGSGDGSGLGGGGMTGGPGPTSMPTTEPMDPPVGGAGGAGGEGSTPEMTGGAGGMDMGTDEMMEPSGPAAVDPSEGCGKANPMTGSSGQPLMASNHQYYVKLPGNYDPNTPYKVIIMFNPTGNPINWAEQNAGYEQAAADAIRVYPHMANQSSGWQPNETSFFQGLYDAITSNFCIDQARVFAAGESSGGEFAGFLGCEYGDLLRGVAPGAPKQTSWQINLASHDCKGNPAAIVIWSPMDNVLQSPTGGEFRDFYHEMNMCGDSTTPVDGFTDNLSNCEMYEGCMEGSPVYFCQHSDGTYQNNGMPSYHGWPAFAGRMTWQVFSEM